MTGAEVHTPGWLAIRGERIVSVGTGTPEHPYLNLGDQIVVPGFVDMHVHGGGGHSYVSASTTEVVEAVGFHRSHGTTTTLASLVTADLSTLARQVGVLRGLVEDGTIAGIHLEGPWLSQYQAGAHAAQHLRAPGTAEVETLLRAGGGCISMVTIAPELDQALESIAAIVEHGVVVAIGHTDADYETTVQAVEAGATVATHLFNAMTAVNHRAPGAAIALIEDSRVMLELIADQIHLHPAIIDNVLRTAGDDRVAFVTDAMAAAGMPDGHYELGGLAVDVTDRVARVRDSGAVAGSTTTMDALFQMATRGPTGAVDLLRASKLTAANPARALGLEDVGMLTAGRFADLVVLDADLEVSRVMRRGVFDE